MAVEVASHVHTYLGVVSVDHVCLLLERTSHQVNSNPFVEFVFPLLRGTIGRVIESTLSFAVEPVFRPLQRITGRLLRRGRGGVRRVAGVWVFKGAPHHIAAEPVTNGFFGCSSIARPTTNTCPPRVKFACGRVSSTLI